MLNCYVLFTASTNTESEKRTWKVFFGIVAGLSFAFYLIWDIVYWFNGAYFDEILSSSTEKIFQAQRYCFFAVSFAAVVLLAAKQSNNSLAHLNPDCLSQNKIYVMLILKCIAVLYWLFE